MRALSLTQPWATLVAIGAKKVETRSWRVNPTELIAIHAAKGAPACFRGIADEDPYRAALAAAGYHTEEAYDLPHGAIVAVGRVVGCRRTDDVVAQLSALERAFGDYSPDRWAWFLSDVVALREPVPCRGALGLWPVGPDDEARILSQLEAGVGA